MNNRLKYSKLNSSFRFVCILFVFFLVAFVGYSQESKKNLPVELSTAYGMLIYQSGYGMDNSFAVELIAGKNIRQVIKAEGGIRIGLQPVQPDVFIRISATKRFGKWKPLFGIETGFSNRMYFEGNSNLIKETRDAMTKNPGHFYLSSHTEMLSFELKNQWNISLLEIDFGTHFKDFGTTVRFQTNFFRIRKTL